MAALDKTRMEALAQALSRGLSVQTAMREAGYSRQYVETRRRASRADVIARVDEIARERAWAAVDLTPIIDQLTKLAVEAGKLGTAAGMKEARELLLEVTRLKSNMTPRGARPAAAQELSTKDWLALHSVEQGADA